MGHIHVCHCHYWAGGKAGRVPQLRVMLRPGFEGACACWLGSPVFCWAFHRTDWSQLPTAPSHQGFGFLVYLWMWSRWCPNRPDQSEGHLRCFTSGPGEVKKKTPPNWKWFFLCFFWQDDWLLYIISPVWWTFSCCGCFFLCRWCGICHETTRAASRRHA